MIPHPPPTARPPIAEIMARVGLHPDPWQTAVLESTHSQLLLNCCRQAGKSTVVAFLGLVTAMCNMLTRVLLVSRSHRQSRELLRLMSFYYSVLGNKAKARINGNEISLPNESRIICLPCREDTIRGYSHVDLLILDEAARIPDDLYRAVRPMLAVSKGRLICLSTPHGKRGFFWNAWVRGGDAWQRFEVSAAQIPRIMPEFLEQERKEMGDAWFRQEYCCSFEALEGLVYPDFAQGVAGVGLDGTLVSPPASGPSPARGEGRNMVPSAEGRQKVGGIDFGFRNPFAAVWGFVDRDSVLWLTGEHYARQQPLSYHASKLPRDVTWYADPAGANEIAELRYAGFVVRKGNNSLRSGIAAVSARLRAGTLRVVKEACPNLLAEAALYRYGDAPDERHDEAPIDEHNHALAALRYLVSRLDARYMARDPNQRYIDPPAESPGKRDWNDERYWIPVGLR